MASQEARPLLYSVLLDDSSIAILIGSQVDVLVKVGNDGRVERILIHHPHFGDILHCDEGVHVLVQFGKDTVRQCDACGVNDELNDAGKGHQMLNVNEDLLLAIHDVHDGLRNLMQDFLEVIIAEARRVTKLSTDHPVQQLRHSIRSNLLAQLKVVALLAGEEVRELLVDARHAVQFAIISEVQLLFMSIKILLASALITLACVAVLHHQREQQMEDSSFEEFRVSFGKQYKAEETNFRRHIFLKNKQMIDQHNSQPNKTYEMAINHFADLTLQEFRQSYLGILGTKVGNPSPTIDQNSDIEIDIDWRAQGKVTRVKNQGMCASCWAFCVVGAMESAYLIKGISQEFSQQQLVDCSNTYGNNGCHGGQLEYTYHYIKDKGLNSQSSYPYIAKDQNCKKTHGPYKIAHYSQGITCAGLYSALKNGPVAATVQALSWGFYKDGIFSDCGNQVNHGVLVAGATSEYWLVKNSWGAQWGNSGYIKLKRGNTCSVCETPFSTEV